MIELEKSVQKWPFSLKGKRALWNVIWLLFGYPGPRMFSPWRKFLLKLFGAKIGKAPLICGQVKVLMPWNLVIGDFVAIAERVDIYNFAEVIMGNNVCVSQGVWLCTGSHDYIKKDFPLIWSPIVIGDFSWIAAESFIGPGVSVAEGVVVGARSVVTKDIPAWKVSAGNPCRVIKDRKIE